MAFFTLMAFPQLPGGHATRSLLSRSIWFLGILKPWETNYSLDWNIWRKLKYMQPKKMHFTHLKLFYGHKRIILECTWFVFPVKFGIFEAERADFFFFFEKCELLITKSKKKFNLFNCSISAKKKKKKNHPQTPFFYVKAKSLSKDSLPLVEGLLGCWSVWNKPHRPWLHPFPSSLIHCCVFCSVPFRVQGRLVNPLPKPSFF